MPGGASLFDDWALKGCAAVEFKGKRHPYVGRIALLRRIGKGGTGVVYYGVNPRLGTEVAVKILPRELQEEEEDAVRRFVQEARLAARLQSPHLVGVLDVDKDPSLESYFIVMEYVRGLTARQWVARRTEEGRPADEADALSIAIAATEGLKVAHLEGVLHRDVKPDNVLVPYDASKEPQFSQAKLADLGLARIERRTKELTQTRVGMGTPGYLAPEQARDARKASKASDVFGLGATLYTLLTGGPPFRGQSPVDVMMHTLKGRYVSLRKRRPDVSQATVALMDRCLANDPDERFPDAPALLDALRVCRAELDKEPTSRVDAAPALEKLARRGEQGKRVVTTPRRARPAAARRERSRTPTLVALGAVLLAIAVGAFFLLEDGASGGPGGLRVVSVPPGAVVEIDGTARGHTPFWLPDLTGEHDVRVVLDGYAPHEARGVRIAAGQKVELRPVLMPRSVEAGLEITSEPEGATVRVDGEGRGRTNLFVPGLAYGRHKVQVTLENHLPFESIETVAKDERTKVHAILKRATGTVALTGGAPGSTVRIVRDGQPPKAYELALDATGALSKRIEAGTYRVIATRAGYAAHTFQITVAPGSEKSYPLRMKEKDGQLMVATKPAGAEVLLGTQPVGKTPFDRDVAAGRHRVTLRLARHVPVEREIEIHGEQTVDLGEIELVPWGSLDLSNLGGDVEARIGGEVVEDGAPVPPGELTVELRRPGYAAQGVVVKCEPGRPVAVSAEPWGLFQARLDLGGLPEDAITYVGGERRSGVVARASAGDVDVRIVRPGFREVDRVYTLELGKTLRLPAPAWVEVRTRLDLSDFARETKFYARGMSPREHGDVIPPGEHEGVVRARGQRGHKVELVVVSQTWVRPPLPRLDAEPVQRALAWLERSREEDGRWDCKRFGGQPSYDIGVTGLALLCFLQAGRPADDPALVGGLKFLVGKQDEAGCFGPRKYSHYVYNHACASLAVLHAYRRFGDVALKEPAARAVDFVEKARNPYLAWRYGVRTGENDTSVTGWMVRVLHTAGLAGLDVDPDARKGALEWIQKMTDPEFGMVGYNFPGGPVSRPTALLDRFPPERSQAMTALGIYCRILLTGDADHEMAKKGAALCAEIRPEWDPDSGAVDYYYWYYGTLLLERFGGRSWKAWDAALREALVESQRSAGVLDGSWDPVGPWGNDGGRVYATAMATLPLIRSYRASR